MIFEAVNRGDEPVRIVGVRVTPKGEGSTTLAEVVEGERTPPLTLAPGEGVRLWTRAKSLAGRAAGYGERPRLEVVVEDGGGEEHRLGFRLRAREYADLRDE